MNIFDIQRKTNISLKNLRKLKKLKIDFGHLDSEPDMYMHAAKIRYILMRKSQLSVDQLLQLIEDPAIYGELKKYAAVGAAQVAQLGDFKAEAAGSHVTAEIDDAAAGDAQAALALARWLQGILPMYPVSHHWVAVRLLYPLNKFLREQSASRISLALMHMRKIEDFRPYWNSVENSQGRKSIKYSQPLDI